MPAPGGVKAALPMAAIALQGRMVEERAALLATLIRHVGTGTDLATTADIRKLLHDPSALSAIVRRAGLEAELAAIKADESSQTALQDVLNRVSPQHVARLLAVLQDSKQPAVNHDATYGESASLGDVGSSRVSSRTESALRELWGHGGAMHARPAQQEEEAAAEPVTASDDWTEAAAERGGWHHSYAEPPPQRVPWPAINWHPALIGGTLALALLLPVLLVLSFD